MDIYRNLPKCLIWLLFFAALFALKKSSLHAEAFAQLSSLHNQIPTSPGGVPIVMESVDAMKNFELGETKDHLIVKEDGVYFFIASGQIGSLHKNVIGNLDLWFVRNGQGIPDSNCRESIDKLTSTSLVISEFVTPLFAGDTIATHFSTSRPALGLVFFDQKGELTIPSFRFCIFKLKMGEKPR